MTRFRFAILALLTVSMGVAFAASKQGRPDPAKQIAAQREAMEKLAFMNGVWRGPAWTILPNGDKHSVTQTERIGPFLDGSVKVIEGRGYDKDDKVTFNAFGTISYDTRTKDYTLHSYAQGNVGDFVMKLTPDGDVWEIPAGPMTIRYSAVVKDGVWKEVGDRIVQGKDPERFFEMTLKRIGDTTWPAGGAVPPR